MKTIPQTPKPPTTAGLEYAALAYLARYGGNSTRLRRILERRIHGFPELKPEVERIVAGAVTAGQVDDAAWASSRAKRLVRRGVSPAVVRGRLRGEGLDGVAALDTLEGDPTWGAACAYVRRRRMGPFRATPDPRDLDRMGRAGFGYDVARRALAQSREEIEAVVRALG